MVYSFENVYLDRYNISPNVVQGQAIIGQPAEKQREKLEIGSIFSLYVRRVVETWHTGNVEVARALVVPQHVRAVEL